MEAPIEARDADPPRQIAAPVQDLHRPFVMTATIRGGDDGNRQNLGVGDLRPHITAMPQQIERRGQNGEPRACAAILIGRCAVVQRFDRQIRRPTLMSHRRSGR